MLSRWNSVSSCTITRIHAAQATHWLVSNMVPAIYGNLKCAGRITLPRPGRAGGSGAHPEPSSGDYAPGGSGSRRGERRSTLHQKRGLGGWSVVGGGDGRRRAPPRSSRPLPAPPWAMAPWTRDEWQAVGGRPVGFSSPAAQSPISQSPPLGWGFGLLAGDKRRRAPATASGKATMKLRMSPFAVT